MTLVQNLRQLLSGNKLLLFVGFILILQSCISLRFTNEQKELEREYKKGQVVVSEKDTITKIEVGKEGENKPIDKKQEHFNIALVLPLGLDAIYSDDYKQPKLSQVAQEFYSGLKLGFSDTLQKTSTIFKIQVFDNGGNENTTNQIIQNDFKEFKPDIIIGPFLAKNMKLMSKYSLNNKKILISPFSNPDSCLIENPYLVSLKASTYSYHNSIAEFLSTYCKNDNIIIVTNDTIQTQSILYSIKDSRQFYKINTCEVDVINWRSAPYKNFLSKEKPNTLVFTNKNEIVINSIITNLVSKELEMQVLVPLAWLNHKSVDLNYLQKMNTSFIGEPLINYNDSFNQFVIAKYRNMFKTEPSMYSFEGYNLTQYIIKGTKGFGFDFYKSHNEMDCDLYQIKPFVKGQGYNNESLKTYKLHKFELIAFEDYINSLKTGSSEIE